ncbi:AMP-binding protein [Bacterioplanoides sp.]|uniref:AMP-binding protein n=1 Tax=Bacterioplanoides sp. TaxID=2066072 RepID=UPI003B5B2DB9
MNTVNKVRTITECLMQHSAERSDKPYLVQPHNGEITEWSWSQMKLDAEAIASGLKSAGIQAGDRVAIWSKNCAEWIIADFAIALLGAVSVPVYPGQNKDSVHYVLDHAGCDLIILGKQDNDAEVADAVKDIDIKRLALRYYSGEAELQWQELLRDNRGAVIDPFPSAIDDLYTIVYTSGTTGNPKGVMHSYRSFGETCEMFNQVFQATDQHRFFSYLPLAHLAERIIVQGNSIYAGAPVYFAESLDTFMGDIQRAQPSIFFAIPRIWEKFREKILAQTSQRKLDLLLKIPGINRLVKNKVQRALGLNKTEVIGCGAAPIPEATLRWFDSLGIQILEGYGMTENACYGTMNLGEPLYSHKRKVASVGQPMPECEVRISEDDEVLLKSPGLMTGYYRDESATASVFTDDGFYRTGDKGRIDNNGFLHIVGRLREQFKTAKAKFIVPSRIEKLLVSHPHIEQACVIGRGMVQPVALAQLSETAEGIDKETLKADLTAHVSDMNSQLEHHEIIDGLWICAEEWTAANHLMTPTLKVKRHEVEQRYRPIIEAQLNSRNGLHLVNFLGATTGKENKTDTEQRKIQESA